MGAAETRRQNIVDAVTEKGFIAVGDLAECMGVTTATIRTDLNFLEKEHLLIRSHGGAIPAVTNVVNLREDEKTQNNKEKKERIAAAAARLIEPNDSITIASGSTMNFFATALNPNEHLNVLTPSLRIAARLVDNPIVSLFFLGGYVNNYTYSAYGNYAAAGLNIFHSNKLFFGVEGFGDDCGLSCGILDEADLTKNMMRAATKIIVLADSTKYRRRGFCHICDMKDIDILVTDSALSEEARQRITEQGVELIIA